MKCCSSESGLIHHIHVLFPEFIAHAITLGGEEPMHSSDLVVSYLSRIIHYSDKGWTSLSRHNQTCR